MPSVGTAGLLSGARGCDVDAAATAGLAALAYRWPPLHEPGDVRRQTATIACTFCGAVSVATGALAARVERAVREPAGPALS
ncbi:hypothetical protein [Halorubellus salinus]|uniref:hypothetical protein n=1 Tax=Halorubellus salinus TaxID=755309 RepID=UPI001D081A45|nr:hypothetical protein [Halorubellus salinus]